MSGVRALSGTEALTLRMTSLLLRARAPGSVAEIVEWFGAMQSQDLASGLWSFGARLPGFTQADVEASLERREALRTWPMRGTVHFVPSRDARWMLDLMGPKALAGAAGRRAYLGLTDADANRAVEVLGAALAGGGRLTRAECLAVLQAAGVDASGQLGYHLLWYASQCGVTCIAPNVGKEQTFVLLDEWVPAPHQLSRDEALATMALRYFRSHGPTTRQDFSGWTTLTAADAKRGIAAAGDQLVPVTVDGTEMLMAAELLAEVGTQPVTPYDDVIALPGFDEYLLGFKDRSLMMEPEHKQAVIPGGNGVFQSTIIRGGRVIATWKRSIGRSRVTVDVFPIVSLSARDRKRADAALEPFGRFVGLPVEPRWAPDAR